jgi:hypothetical protein
MRYVASGVKLDTTAVPVLLDDSPGHYLGERLPRARVPHQFDATVGSNAAARSVWHTSTVPQTT